MYYVVEVIFLLKLAVYFSLEINIALIGIKMQCGGVTVTRDNIVHSLTAWSIM